MSEASFFRIRVYFTGTVAFAIGSLLLWNYYHGGIPSHHILADKDLPEISNLWGVLLLPLLSWFLLYRVQKRFFIQHNSNADGYTIKQAIYGFSFSFVYAIVLSIFFSNGYPEITGNMMLGVFVLALFYPVYRAECYLGFVMGMTVTFGAVLPTAIGSILILITAILFLGVRPAVLYVVSRFNRN